MDLADIENQVIVIASCDEAISPLYCNDILQMKTTCFSLEIIHWIHICQCSDSFYFTKKIHVTPLIKVFIVYIMSLDRHRSTATLFVSGSIKSQGRNFSLMWNMLY